MNDQMQILVEPIICSQIVEQNEIHLFEVKWDEQDLLSFISIYLPEIADQVEEVNF